MPINVPKIDDRNYQQILQEAMARIRVHNPEWTNWSDADPGITILQLFSFLSESLLYRANLIPERNRKKFLQLLGIPMQAAAPAQGFVAFRNEKGPLEAITLPPDLELFAGSVPFRTKQGLELLPVEARRYIKKPLTAEETEEAKDLYARLYGSHAGAGELAFYRAVPLPDPTDSASLPALDLGVETLDGSLWLALLARPQDDPAAVRSRLGGRVLSVGILPALEGEGRRLAPGGLETARPAPFRFEIATDKLDATGAPIYQRLSVRTSGDLTVEPGIAELQLPTTLGLWAIQEPLEAGTGDYPPSLEDAADEERLVTWIRIRPGGEAPASGGRNAGSGATGASTATQPQAGLRARLAWLGINAAPVEQRARTVGERLGVGNGEPDQRFTLANRPVLPASVQLTIDGIPWTEIDDLAAAGPEVQVADRRLPPGAPPATLSPSQVFTVDRESGEVRFGNGAAGHRPPAGSVIRATYDWGGGRDGNVGVSAITKGASLPPGVKIANPLPTWGGDEAETVAEAEALIPQWIQHRDRLVAADDWEAIIQRTPGVDIGRVEILPLFHPAMVGVPTPGSVTAMVIPRYDPKRPDAPLPEKLFLDAICNHLEPRRLVTTEVWVQGPTYIPITLSVGIEVVAGRAFAPVREAVLAQLRTFLSPLYGGREGTGWPLGKAIVAKELWAEAARVEGVSFVRDLFLGDESGTALDQLPLTGLQLPVIWAIEVAEGDPESLALLVGGSSTGTGSGGGGGGSTGPKVVPIPVIPDQC
ncbi:MAG TPA: putative baseplate assembly protein [Symbiobacteriaceae bacterium]|nr:putative baseplate assembly protein [Symbiobacteriaceae bacterium]